MKRRSIRHTARACVLLAGLAAAGFSENAALAQEQPIKLGLGGKLRHFFFVADQDELPAERLNATGMSTDAEVFFKGETTLDSGLRVSATIELETESRNDRNADEAYIDFRGDFGRVRIGEKESFNSSFIGDPYPEAFLTTDERIVGEMAVRSRNGIGMTDTFTFKRFVSDVLGVNYQTPDMNGFQAAVGYHPSTDDREGTLDAATRQNNAIDVSGRWQADLDRNTRLRIGGGYLHIDSRKTLAGNDGLAAFNVNVSATRGDWAVGGTYMDVNPANDLDEEDYGIGVLRKGYPWTLSADFTYALRDATPNAALRERTRQVKLQSGYKLGPGIDLGLAGFFVDQRTSAGARFDAVGAVGGAKLEF
ncbi:MAG: porin [Rhodospirillaceae bacterium]|nr:porin [Rhodospirillaceae bacterium]